MTSPGADLSLEQRIRSGCEAGDYATAVTLTLEHYGAEVLGYLVAAARDEADGRDVFADFSTDLWLGLPAFRWECSLRTWAYAVARHALYRFRRDARVRAARQVPWANAPEVGEVAERIRTRTPLFRRTEVRDEIARLRAQLDPDEQTLLILRLDRAMPWRDIARVLSGPADPGDEAMEQAAAALRKRFERTKQKLRRLAGRDEDRE